MEDEAPVLIQSVKVQQKCIVHRFRLKNLGDIGLPAWRNRKESEMVDPFILPLNQKAKGIWLPAGRELEQPLGLECQENVQAQQHIAAGRCGPAPQS